MTLCAMFRALQMTLCAMVLSISWSKIEIKTFERKQKVFHFTRILKLKIFTLDSSIKSSSLMKIFVLGILRTVEAFMA